MATATAASPKTDVTSDDKGWRIGEPAWRSVDNSKLQLNVRGDLAFAAQGTHVSAWDLRTGARVRDFNTGGELVSFAVSYDGSTVAASGEDNLHVYGAKPFDLRRYSARAFSHDGSLLACSIVVVAIVDTATKEIKWTTKPALPIRGAAFAADDKTLFFYTEHEISRWEFRTGSAPTAIYKTPDSISNVTFSDVGSVLFQTRKAHSFGPSDAILLDLAKGTSTVVGNAHYATISPSGALVALNAKDFTVIDAATKQPRWTHNNSSVIERVGFSADGTRVVYMEHAKLHVVELATGTVLQGTRFSRFAGWLDVSHVAIDLEGSTSSLSLADGVTTAANPATILPSRTADVPTWAESLIISPSGIITASERDLRHEASPYAREQVECKPTLRVWTANGGVKTLKLKCAEGPPQEPGWILGGDTAVAFSGTSATVYRTSTGKTLTTIPIEASGSKDEPNEPWAAAVSDDGASLALIWRRVVFAGNDDGGKPMCLRGSDAECPFDYILERWSLGTTPRREWRQELAGPTSDAITFDHAGKRLLVGFRDGTIHAWVVEQESTITKHAFEVSRISVGPGDQWVFSEDLSGEQRVWRAE